MASDTFDRLRVLALQGVALHPTALPPRRRPRASAGPPMPPPGEPPSAREHLPGILLDEAGRLWRRVVQPWTPTLASIPAQGVLRVTVVRGATVEVVMRNGTYRARELPGPWVPVVVAALTGRELVPVRRALREGRTDFVPEPAG